MMMVEQSKKYVVRYREGCFLWPTDVSASHSWLANLRRLVLWLQKLRIYDSQC